MNPANEPEVAVVGHVCLDLIPELYGDMSYVPGSLCEVGPGVVSTGGAVSNTGLALHRLGIRTRLVGRVGDDTFGGIVRQFFDAHETGLGDDLDVAHGEPTSYTLVMSPPGQDRMFFHCPGANHSFSASSVSPQVLSDVGLVHMGYPPVMRRMFERNGDELVQLFKAARVASCTTSLDMTMPDPDGESGRVDWVRLFERVLPHVDLFLPSLDELLFMLGRQDEMGRENAWSVDALTVLADELLAMGAAVVMIKLGGAGLFVRATDDRDRLAEAAGLTLEAALWAGFTAQRPCYTVDVVGTTGAGDCTIAGFLAGLVKGWPPDLVAKIAAGAGAFGVSVADATSGVPPLEAVRDRVGAGWETR